MDNTSFQSGVLVTESPFLWIIPVVFKSGKFMGYALDKYNQNLMTVLHYAESKELRKGKENNSGKPVR